MEWQGIYSSWGGRGYAAEGGDRLEWQVIYYTPAEVAGDILYYTPAEVAGDILQREGMDWSGREFTPAGVAGDILQRKGMDWSRRGWTGDEWVGLEGKRLARWERPSGGKSFFRGKENGLQMRGVD